MKAEGWYHEKHMRQKADSARKTRLSRRGPRLVKTTLGQGGCPPKELGRIEVAVEEIFVNIVNYAYPGGRGT
jgi:anti-sigma regulatory factor (Ser/Thr protein kinase)